MVRPILAALLLISAANCAPVASPGSADARAADWRQLVTEDDRERLREWRSSFANALAKARAAGHGADIAREGALLEPDLAVPGTIPNGRYRCRVIKLGARNGGLLHYVTYPSFACSVNQRGAVQAFAKLSGSQRPVGTIYRHDALRQVFLGTMVLGDEARAMRYGADPERDVAAWVERVDANRWRMVMPSPRFESMTDVMELVPER